MLYLKAEVLKDSIQDENNVIKCKSFTFYRNLTILKNQKEQF